jgi:hypothetical protein
MVHRPRVLVVTDNASLVIGLTFLTDTWDVASQESAAPGLDADVAVIDLGSVGLGVRALEEAETVPVAGAVLIGDGSLRTDVGIEVRTLPRPFVLLDLATQIDALLASHPDPPGREGPEDVERPADQAPRARPDDEATQDRAAGLFGRFTGALSGDRSGNRQHEQPKERPGAGNERDPDPHNGTRGAESLAGEPQVATEGATAGSEGRAVSAGDDDWDELWSPQYAPPAQGRSPSAPPSIIPIRSTGDAASAATDHPEGRQEPPGRSRWFARRARGVQPRERELRSRLSKVLSAVSELELLIDEIPALSSLEAIGEFLVDDLVTRLDADCAGFWQAGDDGWRLVAGRGLTPIESKMVVSANQPLFSEVHRTGGGLLVDPVDQAQAAVAGIGGAHTESFMAAAVAVGPGRFGILSVGRDEPFTASHLDLLLGVALEAAPGVAVAEQLLRIWARAPESAAESDEPPPRSWRQPEGS